MKKQSLVRLGISYMMIVCVAGGITACGGDKVDENIIAENTNIIEAELSTEVLEEVTEISEEVTEISEEVTEIEELEVSEIVEADNSSSNVNLSGEVPILEDFEETYMTFEDIEPVTLYSKDVSMMWGNPNQFDGELHMQGSLFKGDDIEVSGKGTYKDIEYYVVRNDENRVFIIESADLTDTKPTGEANIGGSEAPVVTDDTASENVDSGNSSGVDEYVPTPEEIEAGVEDEILGEDPSVFSEKGDMSEASDEVLDRFNGAHIE